MKPTYAAFQGEKIQEMSDNVCRVLRVGSKLLLGMAFPETRMRLGVDMTGMEILRVYRASCQFHSTVVWGGKRDGSTKI